MPGFLVAVEAAPEPVACRREVEVGFRLARAAGHRDSQRFGASPPSSWRLRLCGSSPWLLSSTITSPAVTSGRERV